MMEMAFSSEELEVQKAVRKFVMKDLLPVAGEVDEDGALPEAVQQKFLGLQLLRSPFPAAYGGVDGTFSGLVVAIKELSYATTVPAWSILENFLLAYSIHRHGSESMKKRYLPGLLSLSAIGALAFTEAGTGSDPAQLKTMAKKADGGWVLNGSKRFITHSGTCDQMILFARTGDQVTAFLISSGREGYKAGKRESFMHMKNLQNGDLYLEDYFADDDHVIGDVGQGFEILLETETVGKVAFAALFVGLAERALDLSIEYANTKTHRDRPIGHKFQMTQFKLAQMAAKVAAMKAYLFEVSARVDRRENVLQEAASLKLLVAESVKGVTADAMEIHGAYGLNDEYAIGRLYKVAVSAQVVMGSLDIQRVIIAKRLLEKGSCR
jgi:alkylation response protein AidB-like acyl-CoA dehydrogenase